MDEEILTVHDARQRLITLESWVSNRDRIIRQAFASGVSKSEIFRLTGFARTTIARILTPNSSEFAESDQ